MPKRHRAGYQPPEPVVDPAAADIRSAQLKGFGEGAKEGFQNIRGLLAGGTRAVSGLVGSVPATVPGWGTVAGAAIGGAGEAAAELIEGSKLNPARIGVEAGLTAVPLGKVYQTGKVATSALRGAMYTGVGIAGRRLAEDKPILPQSGEEAAWDAGNLAVGAGIGALFGRAPKTPHAGPPAPPRPGGPAPSHDDVMKSMREEVTRRNAPPPAAPPAPLPGETPVNWRHKVPVTQPAHPTENQMRDSRRITASREAERVTAEQNAADTQTKIRTQMAKEALKNQAAAEAAAVKATAAEQGRQANFNEDVRTGISKSLDRIPNAAAKTGVHEDLEAAIEAEVQVAAGIRKRHAQTETKLQREEMAAELAELKRMISGKTAANSAQQKVVEEADKLDELQRTLEAQGLEEGVPKFSKSKSAKTDDGATLRQSTPFVDPEAEAAAEAEKLKKEIAKTNAKTAKTKAAASPAAVDPVTGAALTPDEMEAISAEWQKLGRTREIADALAVKGKRPTAGMQGIQPATGTAPATSAQTPAGPPRTPGIPRTEAEVEAYAAAKEAEKLAARQALGGDPPIQPVTASGIPPEPPTAAVPVPAASHIPEPIVTESGVVARGNGTQPDEFTLPPGVPPPFTKVPEAPVTPPPSNLADVLKAKNIPGNTVPTVDPSQGQLVRGPYGKPENAGKILRTPMPAGMRVRELQNLLKAEEAAGNAVPPGAIEDLEGMRSGLRGAKTGPRPVKPPVEPQAPPADVTPQSPQLAQSPGVEQAFDKTYQDDLADLARLLAAKGKTPIPVGGTTGDVMDKVSAEAGNIRNNGSEWFIDGKWRKVVTPEGKKLGVNALDQALTTEKGAKQAAGMLSPESQAKAAATKAANKAKKGGGGKGSSTLSAFGGGQLQNILQIARENPEFATRVGMGAGGALVGAAVDDDDPLRGAAIGGAAGVGGAVAIQKMPQMLQQLGAAPGTVKDLAATISTPEGVKQKASQIWNALPQIARFNYLFSAVGLPANAWFGPVGSLGMGSLEHGLRGDQRGWNVLKEILSDPMTVVREIRMAHPEAELRVAQGELGRAESAASGLKGFAERAVQTPGVYMTAGDIGVGNILRRHGFTDTEIKTITMTGEAEGDFMRRLQSLPKKSTMGSLLMPFSRTPVNIAEQGARRLPGVGSIAQAMRGEKADPWRTQVAQQGIDLGVGGAAYLVGANVSPETAKILRPYVSNLGGQHSLGANLGFAYGQAKQQQKENPIETAVTAAVNDGFPLPTTRSLVDFKNLVFHGTVPRSAMPPEVKSMLQMAGVMESEKTPTRIPTITAAGKKKRRR